MATVPIGGHVTASLDLGPLLGGKSQQERIRFMRIIRAARFERPMEGIELVMVSASSIDIPRHVRER